MDDDEIRICMIHPKFPRRREFLTNKRLSVRLVLYRTLFVRKDELWLFSYPNNKISNSYKPWFWKLVSGENVYVMTGYFMSHEHFYFEKSYFELWLKKSKRKVSKEHVLVLDWWNSVYYVGQLGELKILCHISLRVKIS